MARIHGILNNASGVRPNTKIVLEAAKTTNDVVIYAPDQEIVTDANGAYDFECKSSFYNVTIIQQGFPREKVGIIQVYSDSVDGSLNEFLTTFKPDDLTPQILKDCIDAKVAAEAAAERAEKAADTAAEETAQKVGLMFPVNSGNWSTVAGSQLTEADRYKAWDYPGNSGDRYAVRGNVTLPITIPAAPDANWYLASSVSVEKMRSESASQLGLVYQSEWVSGIVIPADAMTDKLAYWHSGQFYSVGTDAGFKSTDFDADLSLGKFINESLVSKKQEWKNAGDIRYLGATNGSDVTQMILTALSETGNCTIPLELDVTFSSEIYLNDVNMYINGKLRQTHDGIGIRIGKNNKCVTGNQGYFIVDRETFSDNSAGVLMNKYDGDGGCIGNTVKMRIINSNTPQSYPSITPPDKVFGVGFWMLAGSATYNLGPSDQYERVFENDIDISVVAFKNPLRMEARWLAAKNAGGWVNSNRIKIFTTEGDRLINIINDGNADDAQLSLLGEVSGNDLRVTLQNDDGRTTNRFIYCEGQSNRFTGTFWDVRSEDHYPLVEFAAGGTPKVPPMNNTVDVDGDWNNKNNGTLSNGAYIEPVAGGNRVIFGKNATQDFFPINLPPDSFGFRQKPSYIGVVENYLAFARIKKNKDFTNVQVLRVTDTGNTDITGDVGNLDGAFTPENTDNASIPLTPETKQIVIGVKSTVDFAISLAGITQVWGATGLIKGVEIRYFNSAGSVFGTQKGDMTNLSTFTTETTNIQGIRRIEFALNVDYSVKPVLQICNIFARTWDQRDDKYFGRRDKPYQQFGSIEFVHGAEPIIENSAGSLYRLTVDEATGNVIAVKIDA